MIVETMTKQEINNEIVKDYREILEYCMRSGEHYFKKCRAGKISKPKLTHYKSENLNEWICVFQYDKKINDGYFMFGVYIRQEHGFLLGYISSSQTKSNVINIDYFTKHFFDRYAERLLITGNQYDVIKSFFINDGYYFLAREYPINDDVSEVIYKSPNGLLLGYRDNTIPAGIFNTFISRGMVKDGQITGVDKLQELITDEVSKNLNETDSKIIRGVIEDNYIRYLETLSW